MTSTEKLHEFKGKGAKPGKEKTWAPPERGMLPVNAKLLSIDQSLGACGVVALITHAGWPIVRHAAKIAGVSDVGGNEGSLLKAESLEEEFDGLLRYWGLDSSWRFIHESVPPATRLHRPESSLLSAYAVRRVCRTWSMPQLPSAEPRSHALLMTGDANASKSARRKELPGVAERLGLDTTDIRNEATRDGLSVGLYGLLTHAEVF